MSIPMGIPICPITQEVLRDPVIDPSGHTYEKSAILDWLKNHNTSPITRTPLRAEQLVPNRALIEYIETNAAIAASAMHHAGLSNCCHCGKVMKVSNYKGHKNALCFNCRDWACNACTFLNKCTSRACEVCETLR